MTTRDAASDAPALRLEPAGEGDFEALLALRMVAMRESVERLGRFDPQRARERISRGFLPSQARKILGYGQLVGFVVIVPMKDHLLLDHLYVHPASQGLGIGSWVMHQVLAHADRQHLPVVVTALKHGQADPFWRRHGFVLVGQSEWDLQYHRPVPHLEPLRG